MNDDDRRYLWKDEQRRRMARRGIQWGMVMWLALVLACFALAWLTAGRH